MNKLLYKIELYLVKVIPMIYALLTNLIGLYNVIRRRRYDNPKENNNPYIQL